MDVVQLTLEACALVFTPLPLILLFCGVLFGTLLGALPGLGSILALTVCLPFTLMLDHIPAFALMLGTYVGSLYGGSIASILINVPGTPQAAATNLDGYPMALAGKAAEALGWVTVSAVAGGIFSCFVLAAAAGPLAHLSNNYAGPLEICALIAMGLACITTLSEGNLCGHGPHLIGTSLHLWLHERCLRDRHAAFYHRVVPALRSFPPYL